MKKVDQPHIGKNIARLRQLRNKSQAFIAQKLNITQQRLSQIENSAEVEEDIINNVAEILGVSPEVIKEWDDNKFIQNIQNNYDGSNPNANNVSIGDTYFINEFDPKMIEEINKLNEELIKAKDLQIELLQKMIANYEAQNK